MNRTWGQIRSRSSRTYSLDRPKRRRDSAEAREVEPHLPPLSKTVPGRQKACRSLARMILGTATAKAKDGFDPARPAAAAARIARTSTFQHLDPRLAVDAASVQRVLSWSAAVLNETITEAEGDMLDSAARVILRMAIGEFHYAPEKGYQHAAKAIASALDGLKHNGHALDVHGDTVRRVLRWASTMLR